VQFHGVVMSLRLEADVLRVHADRGVAIQLRGQRIDCEAGDNTLRLGEPATR
jgi:hypothetical protein